MTTMAFQGFEAWCAKKINPKKQRTRAYISSLSPGGLIPADRFLVVLDLSLPSSRPSRLTS